MVRVGFLLFDGFSNMVLSCLLEPLRAVRDQAGIDIRWQVMTPDGGPVRSSSGLSVAPDDAAVAEFELLVVVAGYGYRDHAGGAGPRRILALARQSRIVSAPTAGRGFWRRRACCAGDAPPCTGRCSANSPRPFPRCRPTPRPM